MRPLFLLIFLLFTGKAVFAQDATAVTTAYMRTEASIASERKAIIPKGATVTLQDSADGWYVVNYNGKVGFVNAAYLRQTNEETNVYQPTTKQVQSPRNNGQKRYYTNVDGNRVQSPTKYDAAPEGATAVCRDGSYSFSRNHRGTCSHHGGVARWL